MRSGGCAREAGTVTSAPVETGVRVREWGAYRLGSGAPSADDVHVKYGRRLQVSQFIVRWCWLISGRARSYRRCDEDPHENAYEPRTRSSATIVYRLRKSVSG
jgi:hypothetical protein